MKIHRYYEQFSTDSGLLHDVCYEVDTENKTKVNSLQTHVVEGGVVGEMLISHQDPLNEISILASYSILVKDCVIDTDANMLI